MNLYKKCVGGSPPPVSARMQGQYKNRTKCKKALKFTTYTAKSPKDCKTTQIDTEIVFAVSHSMKDPAKEHGNRKNIVMNARQGFSVLMILLLI